jgi:histidinol-phosphate aminotransferase
MEEVKKLVRDNILRLKPYQSARSIYKEKAISMLDANENPYGEYGRYPDSSHDKLKTIISEYRNVSTSKLFLGNGSDEIIDLLIRVFCRPGKDSIITFSPGFGMYEVCAKINDINCIKIPLNDAYDLDQELVNKCLESEAKLLFLCSPNNPTGNALNQGFINQLIDSFKGIVVIDEAYADFNKRHESYIKKLRNNPKLIILQTLSKGMGMAGLRIGVMSTNEYIVQLLNRIKPPYNISTANQELALKYLQDKEQRYKDIELILKEKDRLFFFLKSYDPEIKVVTSDSNFLFIKFDHSNLIYEKLKAQGVIIRDQSHQVKNALRISVGTSEENQLFINSFKKIYREESIIY